jgi:hypothetical protein
MQNKVFFGRNTKAFKNIHYKAKKIKDILALCNIYYASTIFSAAFCMKNKPALLCMGFFIFLKAS